MRVYVYWFLAAVEDAAAIRSVATTKARQRQEWPRLVVPGVDGPDMNKLERLARPKRAKGSTKFGGVLLDRSKLTDTPFTAVSQIGPEFVQLLAALEAPAIADLGGAWAKAIDGVPEDGAVLLVGQLAEFARQSAQVGLPVLELVVM